MCQGRSMCRRVAVGGGGHARALRAPIACYSKEMLHQPRSLTSCVRELVTAFSSQALYQKLTHTHTCVNREAPNVWGGGRLLISGRQDTVARATKPAPSKKARGGARVRDFVPFRQRKPKPQWPSATFQEGVMAGGRAGGRGVGARCARAARA